ncbi:hypothetical protein F5884DRAFT_783891 [Xylogone sp. PMI_703]|nr:hypothetical protein F5884DRAFT_783891 [Xylogone sp. PMI_703]
MSYIIGGTVLTRQRFLTTPTRNKYGFTQLALFFASKSILYCYLPSYFLLDHISKHGFDLLFSEGLILSSLLLRSMSVLLLVFFRILGFNIG